MDHSKRARFLADDVDQRLDLVGLTRRKIEEVAPVATMHAVLALLDYIQQDDTQEASELQAQQEYIRHLGRRIVHLEEDLEGARAALRARDDDLNTEMKTAKEGWPCQSIWRGGMASERVRCDRLGGHPGDHHGFNSQNIDYRWPDAQ